MASTVGVFSTLRLVAVISKSEKCADNLIIAVEFELRPPPTLPQKGEEKELSWGFLMFNLVCKAGGYAKCSCNSRENGYNHLNDEFPSFLFHFLIFEF